MFPLRGKVSPIRNPHPEGSIERQTCKGECGQLGHGVYDATADIATVISWWSTWAAGLNIGGRVPRVDGRHRRRSAARRRRQPRRPGEEVRQATGNPDDHLRSRYGRCSLLLRRPPGKLSSKRLGPGIDIKTSSGYTVLPGSIHPDTGTPYSRIERPVVAPPTWLIELLQPEQSKPPVHRRRQGLLCLGPSIADAYCDSTSWADILGPHGWRLAYGDGDGDGSRWLSRPRPRRPRRRSAMAACSSTRRTPRSRPPSQVIPTATPNFTHTRY